MWLQPLETLAIVMSCLGLATGPNSTDNLQTKRLAVAGVQQLMAKVLWQEYNS